MAAAMIAALTGRTSGESKSPASQPVDPREGTGQITRTKAEIQALIKTAGRTKPEWWDSVKLTYPPTLDLTGKNRVEGWKPDHNLGAYLVSRIGPNPHRGRESIKLLHHVLTVRKDNPQGLRMAMQELAKAYFSYEKDYARAAFWWGRAAPGRNRIRLAECYWYLGSREMAEKTLRRSSQDRTRFASVIRLRARMGDFDKALAMAEASAKSGSPDTAYLAAGDISRTLGRYDQARGYYQKILALKKGSRWIKKNKIRARASLEAIKDFDAVDLSRIPDGTYTGQARGFRGPIRLAVKIKSARIEQVKVTRHRDDLSFTSLKDVPKQIVEKQGVAGVDAVTGATITSDGIVNATMKALTKASQQSREGSSP
jgi:uncharacterized protein with FMN-binding domain